MLHIYIILSAQIFEALKTFATYYAPVFLLLPRYLDFCVTIPGIAASILLSVPTLAMSNSFWYCRNSCYHQLLTLLQLSHITPQYRPR